MLGRLLPATFERVADEVLDFVVADLLEADVSRWVKLVGGEGWAAQATMVPAEHISSRGQRQLLNVDALHWKGLKPCAKGRG